MMEALKAQASKGGASGAASDLGPRRLEAAERVAGLVRELAGAFLAKAPEELPGSEARAPRRRGERRRARTLLSTPLSSDTFRL